MLTLALANCGMSALADTYYVANAGSDDNDGRSEQSAWRTIARVNAERFAPGDRVLFRRGDRWRGQLLPGSGDDSGHVVYGAYGVGPKPLLMGSAPMGEPGDWTHRGGNIWSTIPAAPAAPDAGALPQPTLSALPWRLHVEGGAAAAGTAGVAGAGGYRVECSAPGRAESHIQLYVTPLPIERHRAYRLLFRARCTQPFALPMPRLMQTGAPWAVYSAGPLPAAREAGPAWAVFSQTYRARVSAPDGRLTFYLGGRLPAGAALEIDQLSFNECDAGEALAADEKALGADVGNIIFDGGASCGVKVWAAADLDRQGEFWYDPRRQTLSMYSVGNPGERYSEIECALRRHIIDQSNAHHVTYQDLHLTRGAAHGIGGGNTRRIIVRDCDFSYIGGGDQYGDGRRVRFGNGVEFWGNARDNLVERCRLWEIYDAALTNQNNGPNVKQFNIVYRNNVIWNCEYSFEYWNRPESSETRDIRFENNTCLNAGHGWGHGQRPDPSGRHLCLYSSPAPARDILIRNNIFCEARGNALYAPAWGERELAALEMDHNCWRQAEGHMILLADRAYAMAEFGAYQAEQQTEPHSIAAAPGLADPERLDFRLTARSPCVDAGMEVGISADHAGVPVPQGAAPDIGAHEFATSADPSRLAAGGDG